MQRGWLDRHCADCVVGAVVGPGLINRQELDKLESNLCDPIDKFPECADITDSQIILSAQRKQRHEHARNLFLR